jgi:hypothetical protein
MKIAKKTLIHGENTTKEVVFTEKNGTNKSSLEIRERFCAGPKRA